MEGTTEVEQLNPQQIQEEFQILERECIGYEDYVNCEEKNYLTTLERLRKLVVCIQREHIFSDNESIKEIDTDNLR